jgi:hypothetical protein
MKRISMNSKGRLKPMTQQVLAAGWVGLRRVIAVLGLGYLGVGVALELARRVPWPVWVRARAGKAKLWMQRHQPKSEGNKPTGTATTNQTPTTGIGIDAGEVIATEPEVVREPVSEAVKR